MAFRERSAGAVADPQAQKVYRKATELFKTERDKVFAALDSPEEARKEVAEIRRRSLANLPALLARLESRINDRGGRVHYALDAAHANEIIVSIARDHGVKNVVKGKSMVSEEIRLNRAIENAGLNVVETDLGEFIVQLAGETPSHMVAPAVHMSKEQIAQLFVDKLGEPLDYDIGHLTAIARRRLRQRFLAADMGITGVNAAIAESGTLMLVENEGNIRLSVTVPRMHVAVMPLEKVVATMEEAMSVLRLLPRSASGQELPSYVSLLAGPRRQGELDGPESFHLVILDNGRSKLLADPELRNVLACIRCGACLNVCPVWQKAGGHSYGGVYSGPIGSLLTPLLELHPEGWELPFVCTQCGACAQVCPAMLDQPKLLMELRRRAKRSRPAMRLAPWVAANSTVWKHSIQLLRRLDPRLARLAKVPGLRNKLGVWTGIREMPDREIPFSDQWRKRND